MSYNKKNTHACVRHGQIVRPARAIAATGVAPDFLCREQLRLHKHKLSVLRFPYSSFASCIRHCITVLSPPPTVMRNFWLTVNRTLVTCEECPFFLRCLFPCSKQGDLYRLTLPSSSPVASTFVSKKSNFRSQLSKVEDVASDNKLFQVSCHSLNIFSTIRGRLPAKQGPPAFLKNPPSLKLRD